MRNGGAGGCWGGNAGLRRVMACAVRATATHDQRDLHAVALSWRRSATVPSDSVCQLNPKPSLTASFAVMKTS